MAKKKQASANLEAKGLFFISLAVVVALSLWSFRFLYPRTNVLGYLGYLAALGIKSLFGLGSYLIPAYLAWMGVQLIRKRKIHPTDSLYFVILMSSLCMLLTVFAESDPQKGAYFKESVVSETVVLTSPYPRTLTRYYLGGFPYYFLFSDLPLVYLEKTLSPVGTTLIFFSLGFVSFLLLTGVKIISGWMFFWKGLKYCLRMLFKILTTKPAPHVPKTPKVYSGLKINHLPTSTQPKKKLSQILSSSKEPASPPKPFPKQEPLPIPIKSLIVSANSAYRLPSADLLSTSKEKIDQPTLKKDLMQQAAVLEETLKSFGIEAKVGEVNSGPSITSFEVHPSIGVKVQKIKALENDIALNMQAKSIRIVAPIPGKAAVGVEVPAIHPQEVSFKEMILHYQKKRKLAIPILLGKAINGEWVFSDLAKMPHCLIAGATGSGKSVCVNTIVMSILMNARPEEIKLLMVDPKKVELTQYSKLPHMIAPVITEPHGAYAALQWLVKEMQVRYEILKQLGLRNITAFNHRKVVPELEASLSIPIPEHMPFIVAMIDEFADLMMVSSADIETPIARIAQMARAVGIHLILATQRPSREVITGIIKANIPTRISFKVASRVNSQIILDDTGAESLLGSGDLLFLPPGTSQLVRAQGAYISDEDINKVVQNIVEQSSTNYLIPSFDSFRSLEWEPDSKSGGKDELYDRALELVLAQKSASTTFLQRKLKIGYARAASLIDELEENGVIGPADGAKPRKVIRNPGVQSAFFPENTDDDELEP